MRCLSHRKFDRLPDGSSPDGPGSRASATEVCQWLERFQERNRFSLAVGVSVHDVTREDAHLRLHTSDGAITTERLVVATGEHGHPYLPQCAHGLNVPTCHSSELVEKAVGKEERVLVVGAGNSGAEITRLLLGRGAHVLLSVGRRKVTHMPAPKGVWAEITDRLGRVPVYKIPGRLGCTDQTPLVDSVFDDAIRAGRVELVPRVADVRQGAPVFFDGIERDVDRVVWATGFVRETGMLKHLMAVGDRGQIKERGGLIADNIGVLGIPCMRTRRSGFLRGFGADARYVVGALR